MMLRVCEPAATAPATLTSVDVVRELVDVLESRLPLVPYSPDDDHRWLLNSLYYSLRGVRVARQNGGT